MNFGFSLVGLPFLVLIFYHLSFLFSRKVGPGFYVCLSMIFGGVFLE
jgi:hypothetical protein